MIPQDLLGVGQQHGNHPGRRSGGLLPACIWAGSSPPLAVSAGPGLGFSSWSKVGAWVPAAGGQPGGVLSLQTDAGSGSASIRAGKVKGSHLLVMLHNFSCLRNLDVHPSVSKGKVRLARPWHYPDL